MNMTVEKSLEKLSGEQVEKINRYTRRPLKADEVFAFSLILCDNEVDRDFERFSDDTLETLCEMFLGKTGIFDHNARADNQSGRIFDAKTELVEGRKNSIGQPYMVVKADAYILRSPKNDELMFEIDGGIKKEVSVGVAVGKVNCYICGGDVRERDCGHIKGEEYEGRLCHHLLSQPTDAYEWSFVAIPAQRGAGVTKRAGVYGRGGVQSLSRLFEGGAESLGVSRGDFAALKAGYLRLSQQAKAGQEYLRRLRGDIIRLAGLCLPGLSPGLAKAVAESLEPEQLSELAAVLQSAAGKAFPVTVQLAPPDREDTAGSKDPFVI